MVTPFCPNGRRHLYTADQLLLHKYASLGNYDTMRFATIRFVGGFEKFGAYEDWGVGWRVAVYVLVRGGWDGQFRVLDVPIEVENRCLICAVEAALQKAEQLEQE